MRRAAAALAALLAAGGLARAESYVDLLDKGYVVIERSEVQGVFEGCDKRKEIQFESGTAFDCGERNHHMAYRPTTILLRNVRLQSYALVIDGRSYVGSISQLKGQKLAVPIRVVSPALQASPVYYGNGIPQIEIPGVQLPVHSWSPHPIKGETHIPNYPSGQAIPPEDEVLQPRF